METHSLTHSRYFIGLISSLVLALGIMWIPARVDAQSAVGSIQIEPAFQEVVLTETTATVSASIKLTNSSSVEQTFELSAVDIQQFDSTGNVILADKPVAGSQFTLAQFVSVPESSVTVPAQSSTTVPILVSNSQRLGAGGHYAAVVARLSTSTTTDQVVLPAVSSFVLIRKQGGELYNLSLISSSLQSIFWWNTVPDKVVLQFSNQGNSHVIPRGSIEVTDQFGRLVSKSIINENSLYVFPSTQREVTQSLRSVSRILPISLLQVELKGSTQPGAVSFQQSNWIIYINVIGLIICLILGVILITPIIRVVSYVKRKQT